MKTSRFILKGLALVLLLNSCAKKTNSPQPQTNSNSSTEQTDAAASAARVIYTGFPETFESGSKTGYADASVSLSTGSWDLNDALIGTSASDRKNGSKSLRIENTGIITMNFDGTTGASQVVISHGVYGTDASSTWGLWYSTNGGSTWTQTGSNITTSSATLNNATFTMNVNGNIRFQLRKLSGGRLNIDDFSITDNSSSGGTPTRDDNMGMGNPSNAGTSGSNNYLMTKTQYALSYNNSKGSANWVSWHLSSAWLGSATRCDCFTSDASLPSGYFKATTSMYTSTGFDRGHQCPSDDRTGSSTDNAATFLMTNIMP
ncbi:MAG: DNA/RNA non-specific endonuclease, partial [Bacteroidia bacterium]